MSDTNTTSSSSAQGLYLTIAPIAVTSGIYMLLFLCLRRNNPRWYQPRSYLGSLKPNQRTPGLPSGWFGWIKDFFNIKDTYALQHQSLDSFLFLRFLRLSVLLTFVGCVITWPVLFPVNATGGAGQTQLDILSYANVDSSTFKKRYRYFAHLFVSWIYYAFVLYTIFREIVYYVNLRQAFLLSPVYSQRLSSRTVLFTSVPERMRDEGVIRKVFGDAVRNIWIIRDTSDLDKMVEERDEAAFRLEKSEIKLMKTALKTRAKELKKAQKSGDAAVAADQAAVKEAGHGAEAANANIAGRYVDLKNRPKHRTGLLGLLGPKVDSIEWCREKVAELSPAIQEKQATYDEATATGAIFVEFDTQANAENAYQSVAHHEGLHMARYIGVQPSEIVWSSLSLPWYQRIGRRYLVLTAIFALILFWAIPVAFVGLISNVNYLSSISFLTWLKKVPTIIMGFITGLLPSVLLSLLMSLVPVIMRLAARLSGEPTQSRVELFTQNAYFCFQVVQVFLVTTLASSATAVVKQIVDNPSSATDLLASNLPKASNFYMSYFVVQGLQVAASVVSQVVGLFVFRLFYKYLTGTPRAMYKKWSELSAISWGSILPVMTNMVVIAITYSVIAPLVQVFACIGLFFFYLAYRYNILYVTTSNVDTRGLIYARALKQLMVGVYLSQVCMIGLYAASVAVIQLVMQIIFLVFTVFFHVAVVNSLDPLLYNMPQSLLAEESLRLAPAQAQAQAAPLVGGAAAGQVKEEQDAAALTAAHTGAISTSEVPPANFIVKFLKPWVYNSYSEQRKLIPAHALEDNYAAQYSLSVMRGAYLPPSVSSEPPLLWIPKDSLGMSVQEIRDTTAIEMTDVGSTLTDAGKVEWDENNMRPPIWKEDVVY